MIAGCLHFKIKNWKLAAGLFVLFCFLNSLGFWQLVRARQKEVLFHSLAQRTTHPPLLARELTNAIEQRFYRATMQGRFDEVHTILLDNKIWNGQVGYEVYTPFKIQGRTEAILVDRGFVPLGASRDHLPVIQSVHALRQVSGLLNIPPAYFILGKAKDPRVQWPLRLQYIDPQEVAALLGYPLLPLVLQVEPQSAGSYPIAWNITVMGPEKHRGYALQWFALALTLLILSITLALRG